MTWAALAPIIARYGIEAAHFIWSRWAGGQLPTAADWDELRRLGKQTPEDLVLQAATLLGLPATDSKVIELLKLVQAPPAK